MRYLIMKCRDLEDQFECDADRFPYRVTNDYTQVISEELEPREYFEVYEMFDDGLLCPVDIR